MERYRVELSLNVWADDDESARKIVENICDEQKQRFDNRCQATAIYESPFGSLAERQLSLF
jgi:hypothetical protein